MHPRRASSVALAVTLVGWVLMAPSVDCARRGLESATPLSEWEAMGSFLSASNCEQYRATVVETEKNERGNAYVDRYAHSVCVPADDPRLKKE
jgi:hypothetical protein